MNTSLSTVIAALAVATLPTLANAFSWADSWADVRVANGARSNAEASAVQQIVITAPKAALSTHEVLAEVGPRAAYRMSDGQTLVVEPRGRALRVRHGGQAAQLLRPDGEGRFVSADQRVDLRMTRDGSGETVVRLSRPA